MRLRHQDRQGPRCPLLPTSVCPGSGEGNFQWNKVQQLTPTKVKMLGAARYQLQSRVSRSGAGQLPVSTLDFSTCRCSGDGAGVTGWGRQPRPGPEAAWNGWNGWRWAYEFQAEELCSLCSTALCPHRSPVKRDRWWLSVCSWPRPQRGLPAILEGRYPPATLAQRMQPDPLSHV